MVAGNMAGYRVLGGSTGREDFSCFQVVAAAGVQGVSEFSDSPLANWLRTITSDQSFLFLLNSPIWYHWIEIIEKQQIYYLFRLGYTWIYLKLWKYCNFRRKHFRRAWHVITAQEVDHLRRQLIADRNERPNTIIRRFLFLSNQYDITG